MTTTEQLTLSRALAEACGVAHCNGSWCAVELLSTNQQGSPNLFDNSDAAILFAMKYALPWLHDNQCVACLAKEQEDVWVVETDLHAVEVSGKPTKGINLACARAMGLEVGE